MSLQQGPVGKESPGPGAAKKATGSIAHATDILLSLSNDVHSVTDIARQCRLSKSTTHRVLKLLERSRLVVEDNINRRYYLGPLLKKLASNPAAAHRRLITCAAEEMRRLADLTGETVAMDVIIGIQYVPLYEIPSQQDLKVTQESKKIGPLYSSLYAGSTVKVLLSQLDEESLRIILDHVSIPQETDRTVTDKHLLKAQLNEIRQKGYCITYGERIPGTMCAAVPIKNYFIPVVLSVVGPEIRLLPKAKEVVAELKLSAGRLSAAVAAMSGKVR
jgi:DNA-binding IclR family transcriptional regulator